MEITLGEGSFIGNMVLFDEKTNTVFIKIPEVTPEEDSKIQSNNNSQSNFESENYFGSQDLINFIGGYQDIILKFYSPTNLPTFNDYRSVCINYIYTNFSFIKKVMANDPAYENFEAITLHFYKWQSEQINDTSDFFIHFLCTFHTFCHQSKNNPDPEDIRNFLVNMSPETYSKLYDVCIAHTRKILEKNGY